MSGFNSPRQCSEVGSEIVISDGPSDEEEKSGRFDYFLCSDDLEASDPLDYGGRPHLKISHETEKLTVHDRFAVSDFFIDVSTKCLTHRFVESLMSLRCYFFFKLVNE